MSENTKIEWCDHTFNPWTGCTKVSPACDHCYAEGWAKRSGLVQWGAHAERRRTSTANWRKPIGWNDNACWFVQCNTCGWRGESKGATCGGCHGCDTSPARQRVFCASLGDWLDNTAPVEWLVDMLDVVRTTPSLDWLLLTKRIGNFTARIEAAIHHIEALHDWDDEDSPHPLEPLRNWLADWVLLRRAPDNVWVGATICNQPEADRDITKLLRVPAHVRFLSMEPLLGPVNLTNVAPPTTEGREWHGIDAITPANRELRGSIDWVIVGGESGPGARPMHPDWARDLRDQCLAAGVSFLFKQWGEWREPVEGEEYNTSMGRAQSVPAFIVSREDGTVHCFESERTRDGGQAMLRVGKKRAGRLLDGREWNEVPA